ncbi:preprotein translocase subunit YajC [Pseudonocardia zijingensis]|jgi:preprotein translocase subunit YajC|uniref:Preprotein translocase subunit YajC n=1 Tax=Pseudonocardia zijingensis TaxID=153376 RepID=A0ABP4ACR8_9PSEU
MELLFPLLILLLFIPIFLSGRRQKRQMQEMQKMQAALEAGDVVMTTSGLRATVVDASYEDTIDLEIADGVVTTWIRGAIREKVQDDATETPADTSADTTADTVATTSDDAAEVAPATESAPSLEKSTVEKDESSNGTPRS